MSACFTTGPAPCIRPLHDGPIPFAARDKMPEMSGADALDKLHYERTRDCLPLQMREVRVHVHEDVQLNSAP